MTTECASCAGTGWQMSESSTETDRGVLTEARGPVRCDECSGRGVQVPRRRLEWLVDDEQLTEWLVAYAIQAGADPRRARERLSQAAQVLVAERDEAEQQLAKWRAVATAAAAWTGKVCGE